MSLDIAINVPEVAAIYGTAANRFNTLRLYRASSRGASYVLIESIPLVPTDTVYHTTDPSGLTSSFYKTTFYNSVTDTESPITEAEPWAGARDLFTLRELRRWVIRRLGGEVVTATGGDIDSVISEDLKDTAQDAKWYRGWHIFRPDASSTSDLDRRVSNFVPATGQFDHGGKSYTDASISTEEIELLPVDIPFNTLNELIGEGLMKTRYQYRYEMGATSSTKQYQLPVYVEGREFVPNGWLRDGSEVDQYKWTPLEDSVWWDVIGSANQCMLHIDPGLQENKVIALDVWRKGEPLEGENDFTFVHPEWAKAAALLEVIDFLLLRDNQRHGKTTYGDLFKRWQLRFNGARAEHGPTGGVQVRPRRQMQGFGDV